MFIPPNEKAIILYILSTKDLFREFRTVSIKLLEEFVEEAKRSIGFILLRLLHRLYVVHIFLVDIINDFHGVFWEVFVVATAVDISCAGIL